jgi:hypothetical protein
MKPRSLTIVVLALMTFSVLACKKTEKGESKRWDSGLQTIGELSATYPAFKSALEEQRSVAQTAMAAAEKQEDKKARVEAMSKANNLLTGGFIADLQGVDARVKKLRQEMVAVVGTAKTDEEKAVLNEAKIQVDKSLAAIDKTLAAGASDAASASAVLKKIDSDLTFAVGTLGEVTKRVGNREQAETSAAAAKTADEQAATEAATEAVAPWTCEYCSHENPHDATTCANCKAARPTAK